MKKVININFQGRVIPIEESAYEIMKQYIESLRQFFSNEEGRDEIINDIESRIGELFSEILKKGASCITDEDVETIKHSIGRPEDFAAEDADYQTQSNQKKESESETFSNGGQQFQYGPRQQKFFRDENNKFLGGVCAGLGNYFGIDKLVIRILFVLFTLGFGFGILAYLILWAAVPSTASTQVGSYRKRLFRDPDNKIISGVCGGLAAYFGVNVWIPRVLFLIPFLSFVARWNHWGAFNFPNFINLSFSPGATIIYIILWLIIPEASTTSDKLEMKGEKIDLNSIKNTIQKDMEGFGERAKEFGKEVGEKAAQMGAEIGKSGKKISTEASQAAKRSGSSIGNLIALLVKIFLYFILGIVLISVVGALFGTGIILTGLLPLKSYLLNDGWQTILMWGTLIFFIWVPVIGIITWIVRRIAKSRSNSSAIRFSFIAMWILGWFCVIGLIASLANDFSYHNTPTETNVELTNPGVNKLEVKFDRNDRYYFDNRFLHFEPFASIKEDTAFVKNIHLRIRQSDNDSFKVTSLKLAYGSSKQLAQSRANKIVFDIAQKDSTLLFNKGIAITKNDKFRNQSIYVTIYVPIGKRIFIGNDVGWGNDMHISFGGDVDDWRWRNDNDGYNWDDNTEYIMTKDGLRPTHPTEDDEDGNENKIEQQRQNLPVDTSRKDSTRYHYQQTSALENAATISNSISVQTKNVIKNSFKIRDFSTAFLDRLSL
ncbi:MAG: PspC domain-containing protein [Bacteroidetes bacterium]|nr:PspC domain-containing protein [Bacteroidota bacterium]